MLNVEHSKLAFALKSAYPNMPSAWPDRCAARLISTADPRLEQNVREWIDGCLLTELCFAGSDGQTFSIPQVMAMGFTFVEAVNLMTLFFTNEAAARAQMTRELI